MMFDNLKTQSSRLVLAALIALALSAGSALAQTSSTTPPTPAPQTEPPTSSGVRGERFEAMRQFDRFLDTHPDVAQQLRSNPALVNDSTFLSAHPELQKFMTTHPGFAAAAQKNPNGLISHAKKFDKREASRREARRDRRQERH